MGQNGIPNALTAIAENLTALFWIVTHKTTPRIVQVGFSVLVDPTCTLPKYV